MSEKAAARLAMGVVVRICRSGIDDCNLESPSRQGDSNTQRSQEQRSMGSGEFHFTPRPIDTFLDLGGTRLRSFEAVDALTPERNVAGVAPDHHRDQAGAFSDGQTISVRKHSQLMVSHLYDDT
jgi:hypothetical protein